LAPPTNVVTARTARKIHYTAAVAVTKVNSRESEPAPVRRRRTPADARQEILRAATKMLASRPAHEVTVAAIMEATTLSRKSFYVYFRDRSELIAALVSPLRAEADAALSVWRQACDPVPAGRAALRSAAATYREHGAILRAVFWSSAQDPEVEAVRRDLTETVVAIAEVKIRQAASNSTSRSTVHLDPRGTALALVTMNIHSLLRLSPEATDAELDALVDTLSTIWERTILPTT
jgi:AcrR family transcriptional regulator